MSFEPSPLIKYERTGTTCVITLNRPEVHNALSHRLARAIADGVEEFDRDDTLLAAVITGEGGRAFSSGADLKELAEADAANPEGSSASHIPRPGSLAPFDEIVDCSKPVIAAIDGYCLAGGFEIALMCDIRVATLQSTFGLPEPRVGLLAGPGLHNLSRMIPLGEALRIQLTGGRIDAERAYQIGLVQALAADRDELFEKVYALADEIAWCAPTAVRAIKKIVRRGREMPVEQSWVFGESYQEAMARSPEGIEGPRAFAEKRPPSWRQQS